MQSPRYCPYLLLLLLWPVCGQGQYFTGLDKDSLKKVIRATPDDTAKALTYIWLGQQYEANTPDSAIYFYEQAHTLSEKLHYVRGLVYYINNYTAILNTQGHYDQSLRLHQQAVQLCKDNHLDQLLLKSLFNIGVVYQYKQDYKAAADHYLTILPQIEQQGTPAMLAQVYNNLAGMYQELEQPEKSLTYARKGLTLAETQHDLYLTGQTSNNIANALRDLGRTKEAAGYLRKTITIAKQTNDINLQETALLNLADMQSNTAPPEQYMPLYREAMPLADSLDDVNGKALLLHGLAMGYYWQRKFPEAQRQALEGLAFAKAHDQPEIVPKMLSLLANISIARGDLEAGYRYNSSLDSAYRAARDPALQKHLQELETQYAVSQQQARILRQDLQLEQQHRATLRQRTWLLAAVLVLLLLGVFISWYYYYNRKAMAALKAEQENTRLRSLLEGQQQERQRIAQEMHDEIGAGLTSLLFLSRSLPSTVPATNRLQTAAQQLVQQMNEIIWTMSQAQDSVDSLVAYVRLHTAEALDNAGIDYTFQVDALPEKAAGQELRRNVYLVCKEAAHNIIRHAQATQVHIRIYTDTQLHIEIKDNGKGMPAGEDKRFGNGLRNMQARMERVQGHCSIISDSSGTTVQLSVPV